MAFPLSNDQVYTKSFTPREYQVELLYAAKARNIIICLSKKNEQTFIAIKLIQEYATATRKSLDNGGKRAIYLLKDEEKCLAKASYIRHLTDLKVVVGNKYELEKFGKEFPDANVVVTTAEDCEELIKQKKLQACQINLIIVDQCQLLIADDHLAYVLHSFSICRAIPRIVGIAIPLFKLSDEPGRLGSEIERLEATYQCEVETGSDILSILRYSPKPKEYVIEYDEPEKGSLHEMLKSCAQDAIAFLKDHRYDPAAIYPPEEYNEDLKKIPDPTEKPRAIIEDFLEVLDTLGPWCADRAALALLMLTEKLKVKETYERHYLLLNMVASVMIKIRALCDSAFESLSEPEKIYQFSTPKVHRLFQTLKTYTPFYAKDKTINGKVETDPKSKTTSTVETGNVPRNPLPIRRGHLRSNDEPYKRIPKSARCHRGATDPDLLCGIIFVEKSLTAKVLFYLLNEISKWEEDLYFLSPLYTIEKNVEKSSYLREVEIQHRKQEEVLKRFRIHECNLLIATSILEAGIEIPKCNFVLRYDFPKDYQSYVQCKSRARAPDALHLLMIPANNSHECTWELAQYHYIEKVLLVKCTNDEPSEEEENEADTYASMIPHYQPLKTEDAPKVTFNSAISLVNRYCAKLPSDTFTRLTPEWSMHEITINDTEMYICALRLPINSPVKYIVSSYAMPNRAMARRLAALQLCVELHKQNEIDDNLLPIGKENFKARPEDAEVPALPDETRADYSEARPGTTKRRQYYYKKIAEALTDCRPVIGVPAYLYHINMVLSCPLPEEQNTRGRRIYPPEESTIGFGILTLKEIPKLCPFPIYTRSGEVRVELKLSKNTVVLDEVQIERVATFLNYTFTNVLRLQKYLMLFDPNASENSYMIVPVKSVSTPEGEDISVDWNFLDCIYDNQNTIPSEVPQEERVNFKFDASKYHDAVIMPWYRNQDQPQYFYVAEICTNLTPKSSFPGDGYGTFEEYYYKKYNIQIQNVNQPLLDVDHTSARLNFLTPRYVNRKGVALPTSSEETKRAKRENLEQKQILVAELCAIHPFPASLWRQAVCLPCILYRINALLLANQIRCHVARTINLGEENLKKDFEWQPLNFGWSLAEVLQKSKETEKANKAKQQEAELKRIKEVEEAESKRIKGAEGKKPSTSRLTEESGWNVGESNAILIDDIEEIRRTWGGESDELADDQSPDSELEIGTWSNEMATNAMQLGTDFNKAFPPNVELLNSGFKWANDIRYGSPAGESDDEISDSDDTTTDALNVDSDDDTDDESPGLKIEYTGENVAEAVEDEEQLTKHEMNKQILAMLEIERKSASPFWPDGGVNQKVLVAKHKELHLDFARERQYEILHGGSLIPSDREIKIKRKNSLGGPYGGEPSKCQLKHIAYVQNIAAKLKADMAQKKNDSDLDKNKVGAAPVTYVPDKELFSFDVQPELLGHPGPSPSLILQALTMSNANDGINLERLETIGDSFLKYAITTYLYCTYDTIHEGKLSHLRSKQVSNLNLYRLGRRKVLGESMIATKFEPHDNWLPPCYYVPKELEQALIESGVPSTLWNQADLPTLQAVTPTEITQLVRVTEEKLGIMKIELDKNEKRLNEDLDNLQCFIPYNLITQHSIPDKSIADCVEALIGAYLIACGPRGALLFMAWLGIHVLPTEVFTIVQDEEPKERHPGSTPYVKEINSKGETTWTQIRYKTLEQPPNPLLRYMPEPEHELEIMLDGYDQLEQSIGYKFQDRSYLLQAFTHASYQPNRLTDCYQRLEFLGDAVLDYLITRHLYEDTRLHSPGALTDLRSALVNNTIFASLAVRCGFHKYFRHLSPGLNIVIDRFVRIQEENGHSISEEFYLIGEDDCGEAEDVEVPKALGDVFESLAGAIYLDSGMSLDAVWGVYYRIMKTEIEQFSTNVPKSPIRELLELEPETAKFGKPEKLADGKRVRVSVEVFEKGTFKGIGRNYRIAKCTAAKCALKKLKKTQSYQRDKL